MAIASVADVTVLALGLGEKVEAEGCDMQNMTLPHSQYLLFNAVAKAVAKARKKLVLVLVSAGGIDVDESLADAVLWQPYAGQAAGDGLVAVLWGDYSPSARLPQTVYRQESILSFDLEVGQGRTHRYLKNHSLARHHFGYGLSFATFEYSSLKVAHASTTAPCSRL